MLFIIMVGGLLVLFIYMTSVASNEKINYMSKKFFIMFILFLLIWMNMDFFMNYLMFCNLDLFKFNTKFMFELCLNKYIYYPSIMLFMMMVFYLLITLISVVKITNINQGPLKQKF